EGIDPSYADALRLLGANVPEPFAKAWEEHRVTTIYGMIDDIENLRSNEKGAKDRINAVRQQVGRNEFIETDVDAFFMSYGDHDKREEATRRLKSILERARKMGLHEEQRILPGRMPGTKIDVAEYFRERCRQYKVDG
ncbi:hypothetical protein HZB90_02265, partial [archaeon]|nr:hypothetical protein [archaeon]